MGRKFKVEGVNKGDLLVRHQGMATVGSRVSIVNPETGDEIVEIVRGKGVVEVNVDHEAGRLYVDGRVF